MKVLITGASSLPGFRTTLEALKRGYEVVALHYANPIPIEHENLRKIRIDITDLKALSGLVSSEKPDVLIHMAALGDVELCERDKPLAWRVTVEPSIALARLSYEHSIFPVYLSTDYVFDGKVGGYTEDGPPNPVNYYGFVKLVGEVAFKTLANHAIVRTSSIYGLGPGRINFAKFLIEKLKRGESVKALVDQYTSPTQARLLAEAVMEIVERRLTGIFHVVGEKMSRYEFAVKVARTLGFDERLIERAEMKDMKWVARRPRDSSLNSEYTKGVLKTDFYSNAKAFSTLKEEYARGEWV